MRKALVLGAGMVGSVMAAELATDPDFEVTIADLREESLAAASACAARFGSKVTPRRADLSEPATIATLARDHQIVLGALASRLGLGAMRAVVEAGRDYCDISFMPEDPADDAHGLDALARSRGVTVVYDFGVAPGMSHLLAAHGAATMDRCDSIDIFVGGLPRERRWPFQYKAAFSPADVIEEYTRPARLVERGEVVTREALSEPELLEFAGVGTLEAFNTDGLRSLCRTHRGHVPTMREKTLRYPGHIELMRAMRHAGLFSEDPVEVRQRDGRVQHVVPREVTAALVFPHWTYQPGEEDLTIMRVTARGTIGGKPAIRQWDLFDTLDPRTGATSMARTTAFPCTILARLVAAGRFKRPGVNPPEHVAQGAGGAALVATLLAELAGRGVRYAQT